MVTIRPFRALRYDEAVAGPLASLVAPPYDVISEEQREEYKARSPHNVVRLTLPGSEEQAARDLAGWREDGALVEDFRIHRLGNVLAVRNAPSPGATSSLAIAEHICDELFKSE